MGSTTLLTRNDAQQSNQVRDFDSRQANVHQLLRRTIRKERMRVFTMGIDSVANTSKVFLYIRRQQNRILKGTNE